MKKITIAIVTSVLSILITVPVAGFIGAKLGIERTVAILDALHTEGAFHIDFSKLNNIMQKGTITVEGVEYKIPKGAILSHVEKLTSVSEDKQTK